MPTKGEIVELRIDRVAFGGQGIARLDGLVIFVKGAIPGDKVRALIFRKKKAYAEAKIQELLVPSSDRIEAPCPYFGICGGCQWQHVTYERQLEYKRGHVEEALAHIGSLSGIKIHDPIPSDKPFAYRNKMEFSFSDRPWLPHPPAFPKRGLIPAEAGIQDSKKDRGILDSGFHRSDAKTAISSTLQGGRGDFALGLHVPGTFDKIIDMDACLLQQERGNEILREVKRFARDSGLPPYGIRSHEGFWRFLALRYSTHLDQWMINLVTSEARTEVLLALVQRL